MSKHSHLDRVHRHLKTGVHVDCYQHHDQRSVSPRPKVQVSDPILRGLLRAIRAIRRSHNMSSRTLPTLRH